MVSVALSSHVRSFDSKIQSLDTLCGISMGANYSKWFKAQSPKAYKLDKKIRRINKSAVDGLAGWKNGTPGWIEWISSFFTGKEPVAKVSQDQPYIIEGFKDDREKEDIENRSSFHKTAGKVILYVSIFFVFASVLAPFVLLPLFLTMSSSATGAAVMSLVGCGILGAALSITSIYLNNSESVRIHRAKTDPDFQYFLDRVVQPKKNGVGINISEDNLKDPEIHLAFIGWRESLEALFTEEKRKKMAQKFPPVTNLFKEQPEILAKGLLEKWLKDQPEALSLEKQLRSIELFKEKIEIDLSQFTKELYQDPIGKSPLEIQNFFEREQNVFKEIVEGLLK